MFNDALLLRLYGVANRLKTSYRAMAENRSIRRGTGPRATVLPETSTWFEDKEGERSLNEEDIYREDKYIATHFH